MEKINIIKHPNAVPLNDNGNILYPFEDWETSLTGGGFYSYFDKTILDQMDFIPLYFIQPNPWESLIGLKVNCFDFKDKVAYTCPYTNYVHSWALPLYIFTKNINLWIERVKQISSKADRLLNKEWMTKYYSPYSERGLRFNKIQRTMLGSGYTGKTLQEDGEGYLYDMLLLLDNQDLLGGKVWIWFNKK